MWHTLPRCVRRRCPAAVCQNRHYIFHDSRSIFRDLGRAPTPGRPAAVRPIRCSFVLLRGRKTGSAIIAGHIRATVNLHTPEHNEYSRGHCTHTHARTHGHVNTIAQGLRHPCQQRSCVRPMGNSVSNGAAAAAVSAAQAPGKFNWPVNDKNLSKPINRRRPWVTRPRLETPACPAHVSRAPRAAMIYSDGRAYTYVRT